MKTYQEDFPFEEVRKESGDYFDNVQELLDLGYTKEQIWTVTEADGDDGAEYIIYGPSHHYVNLIGLIATKEKHDGETYYEYCWRTAEEAKELE